jgi:cation diffusion facilitator family transporter
VGNALIAVTKFIAAAITGSSAMLSEGIHSVVDTGNQVLLLYGIHRAKKPPDMRYPFGHGKEIYFWSFVVALLIFAVGAGICMYEGVIHIRAPEPIHRPAVNYVVLSLALIFEGAAWGLAFREFTRAKGKKGYFEAVRTGKDPSLFVVLFEDSAAMLGLVVAFLGVFLGHMTGNLYFDGAASIVIGLILGGTAIWLAHETKGLLIGESANREVVKGIGRLAASFPEIEHVNEILTMHMGPQYILVNLSVEFYDHLPLGKVEKTIGRVDAAIKHAYPRVKRIFIESESRQTEPPAVSSRKGQQ